MSPLPLGILALSGVGGGSSYDLIQTIELANNTTQTVTFSSLPTEYKHLQVRASIKSTRNSGDDVLVFRINNDSATNYTWHWLRGTGSTINSEGLNFGYRNYSRIDNILTDQYDSFSYTSMVLDLPDFQSTSKYKTYRDLHGQALPQLGGAQYIHLNSALYRSFSAISSLSFGFSLSGEFFTAGSRLSLYGLKG